MKRLVLPARDDEGEVDFGLLQGGKLALRLFRPIAQALQCHAILAKVEAVLAVEAGDEPIDDARVEVLPTEERVARRRDDFEDAAFADFENRDVERAAAGSLMMRMTSRPAIWPASLVAWR